MVKVGMGKEATLHSHFGDDTESESKRNKTKERRA